MMVMPEGGTSAVAPKPPGLDEDVTCPKCEYNLRGLTLPRCPECGFTFEWSDVPRFRTPPGPPVFSPPDPHVETVVRCLVGGFTVLLAASILVGPTHLLRLAACAFTLLFFLAIGLLLLASRPRP